MRNVNNPPRPGSKRLRRSRWAKSLSSAFSSLPRVVFSGSVVRTSSEPFTEEQFIHLTEPQRSLTLELRQKLALELALRGDVCCLKALLSHGEIGLTQWVDQDGRTVLSYAAENGHLAMVSYLAEKHNDWAFRWPSFWDLGFGRKGNKGGTIILLRATGDGRRRAIKFLLRDHDFFSILAKDNQGRTPLSWAAGNGHRRVVEFLLQYSDHLWSDSIPETDNQGRTPLSWAAGNGQLAVAELLVQSQRSSLATVDNNGWTPLNWAWENGDRPVHKFLLSR
ncbi:Ankyrin repeat-containing domain protein, partial [Rhypophila decipiens]